MRPLHGAVCFSELVWATCGRSHVGSGVASWDVVPSPRLTSLGEGARGCGALVRG